MLYWAKSHSKPIKINNKVIFGTRCKPDYIEKLIEESYKIGGLVAKNQRWDW